MIGVVDLKDGQCVRAVRGQRDHYRPVDSFRFPGGGRQPVAGNPQTLIDCYRKCGIEQIYIADLDALMGLRVQLELHRSLLKALPEDFGVMLDVGLREASDFKSLGLEPPQSKVTIVIASESAPSVSLIDAVRTAHPNQPLAVSLDFHQGQWISDRTRESDWFAACRDQPVDSVVALDLAAVGCRCCGRTRSLCHRVRESLPGVSLVTGGGIRTPSDADHLFAAGANGLLVSSLFTADDLTAGV